MDYSDHRVQSVKILYIAVGFRVGIIEIYKYI